MLRIAVKTGTFSIKLLVLLIRFRKKMKDGNTSDANHAVVFTSVIQSHFIPRS